jgi:hypothetical protein
MSSPATPLPLPLLRRGLDGRVLDLGHLDLQAFLRGDKYVTRFGFRAEIHEGPRRIRKLLIETPTARGGLFRITLLSRRVSRPPNEGSVAVFAEAPTARLCREVMSDKLGLTANRIGYEVFGFSRADIHRDPRVKAERAGAQEMAMLAKDPPRHLLSEQAEDAVRDEAAAAGLSSSMPFQLGPSLVLQALPTSLDHDDNNSNSSNNGRSLLQHAGYRATRKLPSGAVYECSVAQDGTYEVAELDENLERKVAFQGASAEEAWGPVLGELFGLTGPRPSGTALFGLDHPATLALMDGRRLRGFTGPVRSRPMWVGPRSLLSFVTRPPAPGRGRSGAKSGGGRRTFWTRPTGTRARLAALTTVEDLVQVRNAIARGEATIADLCELCCSPLDGTCRLAERCAYKTAHAAPCIAPSVAQGRSVAVPHLLLGPAAGSAKPGWALLEDEPCSVSRAHRLLLEQGLTLHAAAASILGDALYTQQSWQRSKMTALNAAGLVKLQQEEAGLYPNMGLFPWE